MVFKEENISPIPVASSSAVTSICATLRLKLIGYLSWSIVATVMAGKAIAERMMAFMVNSPVNRAMTSLAAEVSPKIMNK